MQSEYPAYRFSRDAVEVKRRARPELREPALPPAVVVAGAAAAAVAVPVAKRPFPWRFRLLESSLRSPSPVRRRRWEDPRGPEWNAAH